MPLKLCFVGLQIAANLAFVKRMKIHRQNFSRIEAAFVEISHISNTWKNRKQFTSFINRTKLPAPVEQLLSPSCCSHLLTRSTIKYLGPNVELN